MLPLILVAFGAFGAIYSYFVYPLILIALRDERRAVPRAPAEMPRLTLVVAARNEERRIREKIEESIALRKIHPELEILVASDASTDATDEIVREFHGQGVGLVRSDVHNGKEFAQHAAVRSAHGDVLVFTDSGTTIHADSIERIIELFSDSTIGAVSSTDLIIDKDGTVSGEGLYIRYEMWLRALESRKGGVIGLSGSFFAVRRAVCDLWDTDIPSDFAVAINSRMLGLRAISDTSVVGVYRDTRDPSHEFSRKVRTVVRGMTALARKRALLDPFRSGRLAFQLWSHKVLRWAVPWFVVIYVAGSIMAMAGSFAYVSLLVPVLALVALSATGAIAPSSRRSGLINAGYYFVQANAAVLTAGIQFMGGKRIRTWVPTTR